MNAAFSAAAPGVAQSAPVNASSAAASSSVFALAWRQIVRDFRAGELRLLVVAVMLAVAALSAVAFFADRINGGLARDARQLLGGDAIVASDQPAPPEFGGLSAAQVYDDVLSVLQDPHPDRADYPWDRAHRYQRLQLLPNGCSSFDGEWALLLCEPTRDRLIVKGYLCPRVLEVFLDADEVASVARAVLRYPDLPVAAHDEQSRELKLLIDRREDLVAQRTSTINRFLGRVHELDPARNPKKGSMDRKKTHTELDAWLATQSGLAAELAADELADIKKQIVKLATRSSGLASFGSAQLIDATTRTASR